MLSEKLGYRNLSFNLQHRFYGSGASMYDIDCLISDPITKQPIAGYETKFALQKDIDHSDDEFSTIYNLLNNHHTLIDGKFQHTPLPFFTVVYYPFKDVAKSILLDGKDDHSLLQHIQYYVAPVNSAASAILPRPTPMTEKQFIEFEHTKLRKQPVPRLGHWDKQEQIWCSYTPYDTWVPFRKPQILPDFEK